MRPHPLSKLFGIGHPISKRKQRGKRTRARSRTYHPQIEHLESRTLLSVFVVNDTGDDGIGYNRNMDDTGSVHDQNGNPTGRITLRSAFQQASIDGGGTIDFGIPGQGVHTILTHQLDSGNAKVVIDGTSQPGFQGAPVIEIASPDGDVGHGHIPYGEFAFELGSGSTIKGLVIDNFDQAIVVNGYTNVTIGGPAVGDGNVISGNRVGVQINGRNNVVEGNCIGTTAAGDAAWGNTEAGVQVFAAVVGAASGNTITGNTISGNNGDAVHQSGDGIQLQDTGNLVAGNFIGLNKKGNAALGNHGSGVRIYVTFGNTIGGTDPQARNVISGNLKYGVFIENASNNVVAGNYIGTDKDGTAALGNRGAGVYIAADVAGAGDATRNRIGGTMPGERNLISGNDSGVTIQGIRGMVAADNVVQGNLIGTDKDGTAALGNGVGVGIGEGAPRNIIGGTSMEARNLISGNLGAGVGFGIFSSGSVVEGNYIGTDITGTAKLGNDVGVGITDGSNNTIGGTLPGTGNLISGNREDGILMLDIFATGNLVAGNLIGTKKDGQSALGNGGNGVRLDLGPNNNTIGGVVDRARNVIAGNGGDGVLLNGRDTKMNVVEGNWIGTISTLQNIVVPDNAARSGVNVWSAALSSTLAAQGFTAANGWVYTTMPPNPLTNPLPLANDAGYNVKDYSLDFSRPDQVGENIDFTLNLGSTSAPAGGTIHWLQLLNEDQQYGGFGYQIAGLPGYWQLDNGDNAWAAGVGPFYDSNAAPGKHYSLPPDFHDFPKYYDVVPTTYLHFWTIPTWDVVQGGKHYLIVGATGFSWGFQVVASMLTALPNQMDGVALTNGANNNTIGGTAAGAGNVISGNGGDGVHLSGAGTQKNLVQHNSIGTDDKGAAPLGNGGDGVGIDQGANDNTIGGTVAMAGNVISGNHGNGVLLSDAGTTANVVQGNKIGMNQMGNVALPNMHDGVAIVNGAVKNSIGGTADGAGNVVSGNTGNGLHISGAATQNNVATGNFVGTTAAGNAFLANAMDGVAIDNGANNNTVGGVAAGAGNVISGNAGAGVHFTGAGTTKNVVQGNKIGPAKDGNAPLGNRTGVLIQDGASDNTIGGMAAGAGNIISSNTNDGVQISAADRNVVAGNTIGLAANGFTLPNGVDGVRVNGSNNTVGGPVAAAGNVISANGANGVEIEGVFTMGNVLQKNVIGTDPRGRIALGNRKDGVLITNGASFNTIGGAPGRLAAGDLVDNLISGNGANGIEITGVLTFFNLVLDNVIGTDVSGNFALGNQGDGVLIPNGANNNTIGGPGRTPVATEGNLISGNTLNGVELQGATTTKNIVQNNLIGTNGLGTFDVGNARNGVSILGAPNNTIGGTTVVGGVTTPLPNLISGNGGNGVLIVGGMLGNTVQYNVIGTDASVSYGVGNAQNGVSISASNNTVLGNTIAFNKRTGVVVVDGAGNPIQGNNIYRNGGLGIDLGDDGVTLNDSKGHAGPNHYQNFPVLTAAFFDGVQTVITGILDSTPSSMYLIEFFSNTALDPSGFGQGQSYLRNVARATDPTGHTKFAITIAANLLGQFITATATDVTGKPPRNDTSEFSGGIRVTPPPPMDFGHAPAPYPTLLRDNGARHLLSDLYLGRSIDAERDGQPSPLRNPDPDDDGVIFLTPLIPGQRANVEVFASGAGYLDAWIDFNHDGGWKDAGDQIFTSKAVAKGPNLLSFDVPGSAVPANLTFGRFRLSSTGALSYVGLAFDGEVEDYGVSVFGPGGGGHAAGQPDHAVQLAPTATLGIDTASSQSPSLFAAPTIAATSNLPPTPREVESFFRTLVQDTLGEQRTLDFRFLAARARRFGKASAQDAPFDGEPDLVSIHER